MKPCVLRPSIGSAPDGAYAENAANAGVKVPANEKKKAPYEAKTTEGKALPRNHSSRLAMRRSRPPKK